VYFFIFLCCQGIAIDRCIHLNLNLPLPLFEEWTCQNFCNAETYPFASSPESAVVSLLLSLSFSEFAWLISQPTFCWFLMSQAIEWSPGNCGHDAVSAFQCKPPVRWASRTQLSLITAMSVCLQLTCCTSRYVKLSLKANPVLKQGRTLDKHLSRVFHGLFIKMLF